MKTMAKENLKGVAHDKSDVWYKIIAIFIAACLLLGILVAILKPTGVADLVSLHTVTSFKSENYKVNNAQLLYMTYVTYNNYYNNYYSMLGSSQYLQMYTGMVPGTPLSQQMYMNDKSKSWLDVCVAEATEAIHQILVLCEAAKADNMTLTDEQLKEVEENVTAVEDFAKDNNLSFRNAVYNLYGSKGITRNDIREFAKLQYLAAEYADKLTDSYEYTEDQYNSYYDENKKDYLYADFLSYKITAKYDKDATDEEKLAAIEKAQDKIDELAERIKNGEDFVDVIFAYEQELAAEKEKEEATAESSSSASTSASTGSDSDKKEDEKTDEEKKEELKDKLLTERYTYTDSDLGKWIFADTPAPVGEIKVIDGEEDATVYLVVTTAYRDEYKAVDMYSLYLQLDDFDSEEEMKAYAQQILDAFNKSDKTGESFEALAEQFTKTETNEEGKEFTIEVTTGGLIEDAVKATDEKYEKENEWLFNEERKEGDVEMFEHEKEGISIYYFAGFTDPVWKLSVDADLRTDDYEKDLDELIEKYAVEINDKGIKKIK